MRRKTEKSRYVLDMHGRPAINPQWDGYDWTEWGARDRRTKESDPYSYSEHFLKRAEEHSCLKTAQLVYSDRLHQWNSDAFNAAIAKAPRRSMTYWSLDDASAFLTEYYGKPTRCVALAEGCNASNGYPYWIFWQRDVEAKKRKQK